MIFTNEILKDMDKKKKIYNSQYSKWYFGMSENTDIGSEKIKLYNRSERIKDCLNLWVWDKYEENKILDLQKLNRCYNTRFCPNCKILDISKFIHKFRQIYEEYLQQGYKAYMLTLTIPSIKGVELEPTLKKLSKSFRKLIEKFTYDYLDKRSFKDRYFRIDGGIRVLEITYNDLKGYHPHYHCVVFVKDDIEKYLLEKNIEGKYSNKKKCFNMKSQIDMQLSLIWSMIYNNDRISKKKYSEYIYDLNPKCNFYDDDKKLLEVDFRELDESGIYEVFKYTFKDSHIKNYNVFSTLVNALENKRIRQGFGILYNLQCEDIEEGEIQELELEKYENPTSLFTYEINELVTTYKEFKKISRFNRQIDNNIK